MTSDKVPEDTPIDDLGDIPVRVYHALRNQNLKTVGDIMRTTEAELLRLPNFGRASLKALRGVMASHGRVIGELRVYAADAVARVLLKSICGTVIDEDKGTKLIRDALQRAFNHGFRAAGGTVR